LQNDWSDLQLAVNDADYLTVVGFDFDYRDFLGIVGISDTVGQNFSWTLVDPEENTTGDPVSPAFQADDDPNFGTDWQQAVSGATTANAEIILSCTQFSSSSITSAYPRLSTDGGSTWGNVTGVPVNLAWARAAFGAAGTIMYLKPDNSQGNPDHFVFKSTDGGSTWAELAAGPVYHNLDCAEARMRLRCSANGQVVVAMGQDGHFWHSTNGGSSWTDTDLPALGGHPIHSGSYCDCSVTPDGNTIVVSYEQLIHSGFWPAVFVSTNSGASFSDVSANIQYPASVGPPTGGAPGTFPTGCTQCNVSPDGLAIVVTFAVYREFEHTGRAGIPAFIEYVNVSTDSGTTFTLRSLDADGFDFSSATGLFTAAYIVPFTTIPPPAPPFVPTRGGYIIERLDNRVWPTVEDCWCVDCGFTLARPTPSADLTVNSANGAGILTGVTGLVGGSGYSAATTATVVDANGLGPGSGAVVALTIVAGVITAITFSTAGAGYVFPALVISDPENAGSGASATITMDNSSAVFASAAAFVSGDVGSVIRAGYGVMPITSVVDSQNAIVSVLSPVVQIQPDDTISPNRAITQLSGNWTMTAPISTFRVPQLAGFEITGLADGQIIPPTVVPADGTVTLDTPASAIIVGLAFQAQLQSTYLDSGEPTIQGQRKKIAEVTVRVEQSAAFQIGGNQPDGSVQSPQELAPQWQNMVDAPTHAVAPFNSPAIPLFTGDIRVPIPSGFNTRGQVAVQQLNPLPLQVLDYVPEVLGGDTPAQKAPERKGKGQEQ
jgi:hypothetical protein